MKTISQTLVETQKITSEIWQKILITRGKKPSLSKQALILLLSGDLGSGKTTFTQFLAEELGLREKITSPTFVLIKKYKLPQPIIQAGVVIKNLVHIDAYRLDSGKDLLSLGWQELVAEPTNLIVVEWPERISDLWSGLEFQLKFQFIDNRTREIFLAD